MAKLGELRDNPKCEACFWIEESKEKPQWRFRGKVHFFSFLGESSNPEEKDARKEVASDVFGVESEEAERETFPVGDDEVSWQREILRHFANLGPGMRGTFANPPPGTDLNEDRSSQLGRKILDSTLKREFLAEDSDEAKENWHEKRKVLYEALSNFRLAVIKVERIDRVDLAAKGGKGRRWFYLRDGNNWKEEEVWP